MRGTAITVHELDNTFKVEFKTDIGTVLARWVGELVQVGRDYFFELAVSDVLRWEVEITLAAGDPDKIDMIDETFVLVGRLEEIEDNDLADVRLADSLVCIETEGVPFYIGSVIKIVTKNLVLYDIGI